MPRSSYQPRKVRDKTREVVDYHYDTSQPGKPLHLLIPGGGVAIASLVAIVAVINQTWFQKTWTEDAGTGWLMALVPVYIGGVFLFSLGYELYALDRALALTAIIVFTTVAIVLVVAVIAVLLGAAGSSSNSSSSSKKNSSSGDNSSSGSSSSRATDFLGSTSVSSSNSGSFVGDIVDALTGTSSSMAASPEPSPTASIPDFTPDPAVCEFCGSKFVPESTEFQCPQCGGTFAEAE